MTRVQRWSLVAAYRLTSSVAQRDDDGVAQNYTLVGRAVAGVTAVLYVIDPAVEIWTHTQGASARVTNVSVSRITRTVAAIVVASTMIWLVFGDVEAVTSFAPIFVFVPVSAALFVSSRDLLRRVPPRRKKVATHLLTDVTRHPEGQPGSGRALVASLADPDRCIDGTAGNTELFDKVYAGLVDKTDPNSGSDERVHFTLRPKEI